MPRPRCFNPRARVGRDRYVADNTDIDEVSIRAPAWGATGATLRWFGTVKFQSARPRGARQDRQVSLLVGHGFNPRARVGRDARAVSRAVSASLFQSARPRGARLRALVAGDEHGVVSIRAPAWGATSITAQHRVKYRGFNPRARVGRDTDANVPLAPIRLRFNPRARVGRDRPAGADGSPVHRFNPRARVGRDSPTIRRSRCCECFNPRARVGRDEAVRAHQG